MSVSPPRAGRGDASWKGQGMIYFDNAATSWPKPPVVLEAMARFMNEVGANPGRSGHRLSVEAARSVLQETGLAGRLVIAGINGPRGVTLAGSLEALPVAQANGRSQDQHAQGNQRQGNPTQAASMDGGRV